MNKLLENPIMELILRYKTEGNNYGGNYEAKLCW